MATHVRRSARPLSDRLRDEPQRFALLQALMIAEQAMPEATPLGIGHHPGDEAVRLGGGLDRGFPASDILGWTGGSQDEPLKLVSAFMSLGGAFGPLPPPVSELALERARRGDTGIRDFLDLFNHRLLSIFVRAKRAHRPTLQPGRPENTAFAGLIWSLLGFGTDGLRRSRGRKPQRRIPGAERLLLECAGLLNQRPVSLHAVERLIAHSFRVPVRGMPFVGRWLSLDADQTTELGRRNAVLGGGAMLGRRVWDDSAAIRLDIGPLSLSRLRRFLPGGDIHRVCRVLLGYALNGSVEVDLRLMLPPRQVPASRLCGAGDRRSGPQLGWTSWLSTRSRKEPGEVTLRLGAVGGGDHRAQGNSLCI
jgi:type VI secretion system protein ImpH